MAIAHYIYKGVDFEYSVSGRGKKVLLQFHGFGQNFSAFDDLTTTLSDQYTVYSFNLFFHGNSIWPHDEQPLEKSILADLLLSFLKDHQVEKCSLMGFSLGGKFVLALVECIPQKIEKVFLIAPDGIKTSFWYSLATYPLILRNHFKSMITNQNRFQRIVTFVSSLRIVDRGLLRFAETQMNTEEKRKRVYYSWVVFRHLKFNLAKIGKAFNKNSIKLTIIVGEFDKVITAKNMNRLIMRVPTSRLEVLPAGHNDLIRKSAEFFARLEST